MDRLFGEAGHAFEQHDYATAERIAREGTTKAEALGETRRAANFWRNLGITLTVTNRADEGLNCLRRAKEFFARLHRDPAVAVCWQDMGRACYAQENYEDAVRYGREATNIAERLGDLSAGQRRKKTSAMPTLPSDKRTWPRPVI